MKFYCHTFNRFTLEQVIREDRIRRRKIDYYQARRLLGINPSKLELKQELNLLLIEIEDLEIRREPSAEYIRINPKAGIQEIRNLLNSNIFIENRKQKLEEQLKELEELVKDEAEGVIEMTRRITELENMVRYITKKIACSKKPWR